MRSSDTMAMRPEAQLFWGVLLCTLLAAGSARAAEGPPAEPAELAAPAEPVVWHSITDPDEGFVAAFPAEPTKTSLTFKTLLGSIVATKYYVYVRGALFAVERHPLPRLRFFSPSSLILDRAKKGVLSDRNAEQISFSKPEESSHPQRILVYRTQGTEFASEEVHLHLRGRSLYLVTAESGQGEGDPATARRFFDSFRLLEPED